MARSENGSGFALRAEIEKCYADGTRVVAALSIPSDPPQVSILFGPSGAGKTTLLRCIAGLERPTAGQIEYGSQVWSDVRKRTWLPPQKRPVGYLFQDFALFPHLSVRGNIAFGLGSLSRTERNRCVDAICLKLGLEGLGERRPQQLSGGTATESRPGSRLGPPAATAAFGRALLLPGRGDSRGSSFVSGAPTPHAADTGHRRYTRLGGCPDSGRRNDCSQSGTSPSDRVAAGCVDTTRRHRSRRGRGCRDRCRGEFGGPPKGNGETSSWVESSGGARSGRSRQPILDVHSRRGCDPGTGNGRKEQRAKSSSGPGGGPDS